MIAQVIDRRVALRRDSAGEWHPVASMPCGECGCPMAYSTDEPGLWWDAGQDYAPDCTDLSCDCHVAPTEGMRVSVRIR